MAIRRLLLAGALIAVLVLPAVALAYPRDNAAVVEVDIFSRADIHRLNELGMDIMNVREGVAEIASRRDAIPRLLEPLSSRMEPVLEGRVGRPVEHPA